MLLRTLIISLLLVAHSVLYAQQSGGIKIIAEKSIIDVQRSRISFHIVRKVEFENFFVTAENIELILDKKTKKPLIMLIKGDFELVDKKKNSLSKGHNARYDFATKKLKIEKIFLVQ